MVNIPEGLNLNTLLESFADANGYVDDGKMLKVEFGKRKLFKKLSENAIILWLPHGTTKDKIYEMIAFNTGYKDKVEDFEEKTSFFNEDDPILNSADVLSIEPTGEEDNGKKVYKVTYMEKVIKDNPITYKKHAKIELGKELSKWIDELNNKYVNKRLEEVRKSIESELSNPARSEDAAID